MRTLLINGLLILSSVFGSDVSFITPDLLHLLKVMEIPHDGTPNSIAIATQKKWTRPTGKERWQIEDILTVAQRQTVFEFCQKQHFFDEIGASRKQYDYGIIVGGAVGRMEKRISHFVKLFESGVRFKRVVLLPGARPLDNCFESVPEGCKTEGEALRFLWEAQAVSQEVKWELLETPMIPTVEGQFRRPGTSDVYLHWLKTAPAPGSCLFFSNQPFCLYQNAVAQLVMPEDFSVETAGAKADPTAQNGMVLLEAIADWIFYETKKSHLK